MYPVIFRFGPLTLYSYGLVLGVAFVAASLLAAREAERRGIGGEWMYDFLLVTLISGVIASRALYVILNFGLYRSNPWTVLNIAEGGLSLHGAIAAGSAAAAWFCRKKGVSFYALVDTIAPSAALAIGIGRWGCLLNGCCYGVLTSGSWGVLTRYAPGLRHPTQIYESIAVLALFAILWSIRTRVKVQGQLFMLFLAMYSAIRFFVEFFRESAYVGPLTHAQAGSIAIAAVALFWYHRLERRAKASAQPQ